MVAIQSSLVILKEAKEELQRELTTLEHTDAHKSAQHIIKLKRQINAKKTMKHSLSSLSPISKGLKLLNFFL
jgi:hypothetical protein